VVHKCAGNSGKNVGGAKSPALDVAQGRGKQIKGRRSKVLHIIENAVSNTLPARAMWLPSDRLP